MSETINYRAAIARAIADAMAEDPTVIMLGEDVGAAGSAFKSTVGVFERFGPERVLDTPISEQAIVGSALGAALCGLRPIVDLMFADFAGVAFDQIANQVAKYRYMTGGQVRVPLTIRMTNGAGAGFGSQHSQPAENWLLNIPGLKIAVPATVPDLYGLIRTAVREDNPVLVFEHKGLFAVKGEVPGEGEEFEPIPLGRAAVVRSGRDLTVVATQQMRHRAEQAARTLAEEGIDAAVIDPRCLVPFDDETVIESLRTTSRLLVVQEAPPAGSWGASLIARLATGHFDLFDAPPVLLAADETPIPYAGNLEDAWMPSTEEIVASARKLADY